MSADFTSHYAVFVCETSRPRGRPLREHHAGAIPTRRSLAASSLVGLVGLVVSPSTATLAAGEPTVNPSRGNVLSLDAQVFGALGDGTTDDALAINAAIAAARKLHRTAGSADIGCRIVFPTGVYAVHSPLDLTNLRDINTVIDGQGSIIVGRCPGRPVIDAIGARWLTIRDLVVVGDRDAVPSVGLQIGLASADTVADDHSFVDVKIVGHFSLACLYNRAAETTGFDHVLLWNDHPNAFCLIQDGMNHFDVRSAFVATTIARDQDLSFNENEFINCDFRHGAGGTPVWLGDTARHAFIRCYSATAGGPSFVVHCGSNSHTMLDVDCHCEAQGLRDVFRFEGAAHLVIRGFSYRDHDCFAGRAVLTASSQVQTIQIEAARLDVAQYRMADCRLFDGPDRWSVTGTYYGDRAHWNGQAAFRGVVMTGADVALQGVAGARALSGTTKERPRALTAAGIGTLYWDSSTEQLLVWSGKAWQAR